MLKRIPDFIFMVFLILLPLQTVWLWREPMIDGSKWQYGTIGIYGTDILLLLGVSFVLLNTFRQTHSFAFGIFWYKYFQRKLEKISMAVFIDFFQLKGNIFVKKFHRERMCLAEFIYTPLLFIIFWSGLSLFWAEDTVLAGYFFFKLVLAGMVFYWVQNWDIHQYRKVFWLIIFVAITEVALGIWQFLFQTSFASTLLGMSGYESWQAGVSVLKNESGRWLRAYGTFPHPNIYGAYMSVALVGVVSYTVFFAKKYITYVSVALSLLLGLILSFSRSSWVGAALSVLVLGCVVIAQGESNQKRRSAKVFGIIGITAILFVSILHDTVFSRFDNATIQKEASVVDRSMLIHQAIGIIKEHPLVGVGAGNYTEAIMQKYPEIPVWEAQPVHNVFLLIFAELGVIGFIVFISFLLLILYFGVKNVFSKNTIKENTIFFIAFLSLIPSLFLDHFLWDSHFGLLFSTLLAGLVLNREYNVETKDISTLP